MDWPAVITSVSIAGLLLWFILNFRLKFSESTARFGLLSASPINPHTLYATLHLTLVDLQNVMTGDKVTPLSLRINANSKFG